MNAEMLTVEIRAGEEKGEPESREDNKISEDHELVKKTSKQSKTHSHGGSKRPKVQEELAITLAPGFPWEGDSSATYVIINRKEPCQIQGTVLHQTV